MIDHRLPIIIAPIYRDRLVAHAMGCQSNIALLVSLCLCVSASRSVGLSLSVSVSVSVSASDSVAVCVAASVRCELDAHAMHRQSNIALLVSLCLCFSVSVSEPFNFCKWCFIIRTWTRPRAGRQGRRERAGARRRPIDEHLGARVLHPTDLCLQACKDLSLPSRPFAKDTCFAQNRAPTS